MAYIQPKLDYKDGDVLHGIDLNASNEVIKAGVDDNFDRIQGLEIAKQDVIDSSNRLDYSLLDNTPDIPTKVSDLDNDTGFVTSDYHDNTKQDVLTAGEGISIEGDVISNTQTSAEWGNIQGDITDQADLQAAFNDKVDKIEGKQLSTEDYTTVEKTKLGNIESGAEANIIETIKVDNTALTPDASKAVNIDLSGKQDELVSGTNIKTINNQSLLGSGNITIQGGGGGTSDYDHLENRPQINNVTLSGNKSLSDLGINIPTKLSDLNNDNNTVTDASYVHTDNNYTSSEKTKLGNIESGAEVNIIEDVKVNGTSQTVTSKAIDITIPTKLSDLTNDNNTVTDASYVHTDNNYTSTEKTKLAGIETGAQANVDEILIGDESAATADTKLIIEESDLDFQGLEIANEYTTGNNVAYSANYANKAFGGTILWTNPNLTSSFTAQNITLNSDDYDVYECLYFLDYTISNRLLSCKSIKGKGFLLDFYDGYEQKGAVRSITYTNATQMNVQVSYYNGAASNNYCIPYMIIGYKTNLFN